MTRDCRQLWHKANFAPRQQQLDLHQSLYQLHLLQSEDGEYCGRGVELPTVFGTGLSNYIRAVALDK